MKAYWKSQWPNICIGLVNLILAVVNLCQGDEFMALCWVVSSVVWLIMARVDYNEERIKALEREVKQLKDRAITDVDVKDFPNIHFRHGLSTKKEDQ